jgi:hypothetical protein
MESSMVAAAMVNGNFSALSSIHHFAQGMRMRQACARYQNYIDIENGNYERCALPYQY